MKGLSGGLISNSACAYAFMNQPQFAHVAPIWGIQREQELDEFLAHGECPPVLDEELQAIIEHDVKQLSGDFCRGCGYCMPCPAGIGINNCARMSLMLREEHRRQDGCLKSGRKKWPRLKIACIAMRVRKNVHTN